MGLEFIATMTGLIALILICGAVSWVFVQVEEFIKTNQMSKGVAAIYVVTAVACAAIIITFSYLGSS